MSQRTLTSELHDDGVLVLTIDVPGGTTVADVWSAVVAAHPAAGAYARSMSCAVNLDYARMTTTVADGDEVAFLPPVSGGSGVAPR